MVSVCLPSDALSQHLPSYLGSSYLGHGVSLHSSSSKVQPLHLTLDQNNSIQYYLAAATAAKLLQSCPALCDPIDGSPPGSPVPGILQAKTLDGLPFPSPMHESEKWKWSRSVVSDPQRPHGLQPTRLLHPWDSPGKSTGVGCHCLLHCYLMVLISSYKYLIYYFILSIVNRDVDILPYM